MRKFLLSTIALMMSVAMMAVGAGNGTSKANAIDFDWADGHKPALSAGSWYRVDLTPLKAEANDPTLALYLTNLTDETASVTVNVEASVSVLGQTQSGTKKLNYSIKGKDFQLWSVKSFEAAGRELTLKQLMNFGLSELYLQLTANKEIALSAKVYETEEIVDDACSKAVDFNWAGESVPAGEKWFRLNLSEIKAGNKQLKFVVANDGAATANVAFDMSLDCPASAVIEKDWVIAVGDEKNDEFGRVFLDVLKEDYVFLKLTNDQPITLSVEEEVVVIDPDKYVDFNCATAPELVLDAELNLTAGAHVYKVLREDLISGRGYAAEFYVTNATATPANLKVETAFACPVKSAVEQNLTVAAGETIVKGIKGGMLEAVNSEWVYLRFTTDQDLTAIVGMRNTDPCVAALPFDWTVGATQEAGTTQWYEMDITSLKQNKQHLYLEFTNHANSFALLNVEVALDCGGTKVPLTLPVPANMNVGQTIDYNLLKLSPLNRVFIGVTTDSKIELKANTKEAIAADPAPCLDATDVAAGVQIVQEPSTKWYRMSLDLLRSNADLVRVYMANKSNQRAHVTVGLVTDCQYTVSTAVTIPVPANFEINQLVPNFLGRLLDELVRFEEAYGKVATKDVYLQIQTDQTIHFGLGLEDIVIDDPCASGVVFDWADWEKNGMKLEDGQDTWYKVDVMHPLKKVRNGEEIVVSLVNPSAVKKANVHVEVSPTCPVFVDVQKNFTVPVKSSLTKEVTYSLVKSTIKQYAQDLDKEQLLDKLEGYTLFNKLMKLHEKYGHHIPYDRIKELVEEYKDYFTEETIKEVINNYEKYINVAELKEQILKVKEYISYDDVAPLIEKFGEYIPYEKAKDILLQYDELLPYADGVVGLLNKCTTYISYDNLYKLIDRVKQHVPVEKIKDLLHRIENRLAGMEVYAYVHVITDGELEINPGLPIEPGCPDAPIEYTVTACDSYEWKGVTYTVSGDYADTTKSATCDDAEWLDWKQTIKLSEFTAPWYKIDVSEIIANQSEFTLTFDNDLAVASELALELHYYCSEDNDGFVLSASSLVEPGVYTRTMTYEEFDAYVGPDYKTLYLHNVNADCDVIEILHLTIEDCDTVPVPVPCYEVATINEYVCDGTEFVDPITGKKHVVASLLPDQLTWSDTVVTGLACDSIYTFNITPIVAPEELTVAILATIPGATPILVPGQAVDVTGTVEAIKAYYAANDTEAIADVESVEWTAGADVVLADDATSHAMTLKVVAGCEFELNTPLVFPVSSTADGMVGVVKRAVQFADAVVVLTHEADGTPHLYKVVDGEAVAELSQEGVIAVDPENAGDLLAISDIAATEDGKLVAINYMQTQSGDDYVNEGLKRGETRVYLWNDLAGDPAILFTSKMSSNWFRSKQGLTLAVKGTSDNMEIFTTGIHATSAWARVSSYRVINGVYEEPAVNHNDHYFFYDVADAVALETTVGTQYELTASPLGAMNWILDAELINPVEIVEPETNNVEISSCVALSQDLGKKYQGTSIVTVGEQVLMVAPYADADGKLAGVKALDITAGLDAATEAAVADLAAAVEATAAATAVAVNAADRELTVTLVADATVYTLVIKLADKEKLYGTISEYVCDASDYVDPIAGEIHTISSLIPASQTWESVKSISATTDSVYTFVITPMVAPVVITEGVLKNIPGAIPTLVAGQKADVTGTVDAIKAYYAAQDKETIADIESVEWIAGADAAIACDATSHTMTLKVVAGCDFDVTTTITLPVTPVAPVETSVVACDSYEWHGQIYTTSGDYTYGENCQIEILHLTINKTVYTEETAVACDSYEWNGATYTTSDDYTYTTTAANGCDSVVTLHLTINKSDTVEFTEVACDSYEWHGTTYTTSDDYKFETTTEAGCYRLEILHLTINHSKTEDVYVTACDSYEWNGTTYTASGEYNYPTTTVAGCDSTAILHLTINVSTAGTQETTICPGDSYEWNGATYDKADTYHVTLTNAAGCDSVATLILSIQDPDNDATEYDQVAAVSKYGNRLLLFNLNAFNVRYGWTPAEAEVTWFKVNGTVDEAYEALHGNGDDTKVGTGFYYNEDEGSPVAGEYYALVEHTVSGEPCASIWRTVTLTTAAAQNAPQLLPTVARPDSELRVLNLNPSSVTDIRVYNTTGELVATYTSAQASEFMFKAATLPGYYMVEVQAEGDKVTLRYIVK